MPMLPFLLPVQKALLIELVEATERVSPVQRTHFVVGTRREADQEITFLEHPGLPGQTDIHWSDIETLARKQLLVVRGQPGTSYTLILFSTAYVYYGLNKHPVLAVTQTAVREAITEALTQTRRAINALEVKVAQAGGPLGASVELVIELEDKTGDVAALQQRLKDLDEDMKAETP